MGGALGSVSSVAGDVGFSQNAGRAASKITTRKSNRNKTRLVDIRQMSLPHNMVPPHVEAPQSNLHPQLVAGEPLYKRVIRDSGMSVRTQERADRQ